MSPPLEIDVSELPPPEPMERILDALENLPRGEYLRVRHSRQPWPLFDILGELGYDYEMEELGPSAFEIRIWRAADAMAAAQARNVPA